MFTVITFLSELETAAAQYNSIQVQPSAMVTNIEKLVNGKFRAVIIPPLLENAELEYNGPSSESVLWQLRQKIGIRSATVSRPGLVQLCLDR
jgi:hypothetical protein